MSDAELLGVALLGGAAAVAATVRGRSPWQAAVVPAIAVASLVWDGFPVGAIAVALCAVLWWPPLSHGSPDRTATDCPEIQAIAADEASLRQWFAAQGFLVQAADNVAADSMADGAPDALYYRGRWRGEGYLSAYQTLAEGLRRRYGDRVVVWLTIDPEGNPEGDDRATDYTIGIPYLCRIAIAPSDTRERKGYGVGLAVLTTATLLYAAAQLPLSPPQQIVHLFLLASAIAIGEVVRARVARSYGMTLTATLPIPYLPPWGVASTFPLYRERFPHRQALFDMAIAPLVARAAVSIIFLGVGCMRLVAAAGSHATIPSSDPAAALFPVLPLALPQSLAIAAIAQIASFGHIPLDGAISDPWATAGWVGLLTVAVDAIPLGGLGGGCMVRALFAAPVADTIGRCARLSILLLAFSVQPALRLLAIALFLIPPRSYAALDETQDLSDRRFWLGVVCLALAWSIWLPAIAALEPG